MVGKGAGKVVGKVPFVLRTELLGFLGLQKAPRAPKNAAPFGALYVSSIAVGHGSVPVGGVTVNCWHASSVTLPLSILTWRRLDDTGCRWMQEIPQYLADQQEGR